MVPEMGIVWSLSLIHILHYQAKRAFAPVLVDAVKEGEDLNIYVMSDKLEADKEVTLLSVYYTHLIWLLKMACIPICLLLPSVPGEGEVRNILTDWVRRCV